MQFPCRLLISYLGLNVGLISFSLADKLEKEIHTLRVQLWLSQTLQVRKANVKFKKFPIFQIAIGNLLKRDGKRLDIRWSPIVVLQLE